MTWYDELDKWTADYLPDMPYEHDVPLSRYTSFRIGGPARRMAFPQNGEQLILLLSQARDLSARPFVLGNGTNLLCPDGGVDRLVIHTRDLIGHSVDIVIRHMQRLFRQRIDAPFLRCGDRGRNIIFAHVMPPFLRELHPF